MNRSRIFWALGLASGIAALALGVSGCPTEPEPVSDNCGGLASGSICTWAGTSEVGLSADGTHRAGAALYFPIEIEFSPDGTPYIADWNNHRVIYVNADQTIATAIGAELPGDGPLDGTRGDLTEPGIAGDLVALNHPTDIAFEPSSGLAFTTNWHNHKIRRYDPADGNVYVVAGRGPGFAGDGAALSAAARLRFPASVAFATDGTLYFVDAGNDRIRTIDGAGNLNTFAGDGMQGYNGDGADRLATRFSFPLGTLADAEVGGAVAFGPDGNLYVADFQNHRIRMIDMSGGATDGVVTTVAGKYMPPADVTAIPAPAGAFSGDGGAAVDAELSFPYDIDFGPDGNLYFSDSGNNRVRMVNATDGTISTVAGNGDGGFVGDAGPATSATLDHPRGIAFGPDGNLYIADQWNHRIRMVVLGL